MARQTRLSEIFRSGPAFSSLPGSKDGPIPLSDMIVPGTSRVLGETREKGSGVYSTLIYNLIRVNTPSFTLSTLRGAAGRADDNRHVLTHLACQIVRCSLCTRIMKLRVDDPMHIASNLACCVVEHRHDLTASLSFAAPSAKFPDRLYEALLLFAPNARAEEFYSQTYSRAPVYKENEFSLSQFTARFSSGEAIPFSIYALISSKPVFGR